MFTKISDNPATTAAIIGFATTLLALLVAFGVHVTPEQTQAILGFIGALWLLVGIIARVGTVAKTPSDARPSLLQVPPPGTVLVTTDSAAASAPIPASAIVAASSTTPPATP
jgi:hypothetical protein